MFYEETLKPFVSDCGSCASADEGGDSPAEGGEEKDGEGEEGGEEA